MSPRRPVAVSLLVAAAAAWPMPAMPDRPVVVFITPRPPPPPVPQHSFPAQPPLQWAPPPALGPIPGQRSPTARCYAGTQICPLADADRVGEPCTCGSGVSGRALIPPSHDTVSTR